MFLAIIGTSCSGKKSVQDYLIQKGFISLHLRRFGSSFAPDMNSTRGLHTDSDTEDDWSIDFESPADMLEYATLNWKKNLVTTSLSGSSEELSPFIKRPFFLLVRMDAPILTRWRRSRGMQKSLDRDSPVVPATLEDFIEQEDGNPFARPTQLYGEISVSIYNNFPNLKELHEHLESINLLDPDRVRPSWDTYFMKLADLASQRSNCMKRRVGAILVRGKRIVSTGYNGTPRNMTNCNEGGCTRCNGTARSGQALDECLCLHAEENALLEAGRERIGEGAILYCNTCPCLRCSVKIVQTGVKQVVYSQAYSMDEASAKVFREAGVTLRQHLPPP
jgi:dCMP deaminase